LVRGKVFSLISESEAGAAARYFDLAYSYTWLRSKPFVIMISGLTGSGKSTLARALGRRLGVPVINSDVVRKSLAAGSNPQSRTSNGEGIYSAAMTGRTYRKMIDEAESRIAEGEAAIVDATFQKGTQRAALFEAAERRGAPVAIIHCHAREALVQERLQRRAEEARDISDGTWRIYLKQKERFEPFVESPPYLALDTEQPVAELCAKAEEFLRAAFAGREKRIGAYPVQQPASSLFPASR
jgi:predicted kinase